MGREGRFAPLTVYVGEGMSNRFGSLLIAALLALEGCGGTYYNYFKPGASAQQHAQDNYECMQASQQSYIVGAGGTFAGGTEPKREIWIACLQARGYTISVKSEDEVEREQQVRAARELALQQRQAEYQQLMTEKRVLDEQRRVFNEQKRVLDEQRAALPGGAAYASAVADFNKRNADHNKGVADFNKRDADYNKRVADYEKRRTADVR